MRLIQHLNGETEVKTAHHRYQIWDNDGELQGSPILTRPNNAEAEPSPLPTTHPTTSCFKSPAYAYRGNL